MHGAVPVLFVPPVHPVYKSYAQKNDIFKNIRRFIKEMKIKYSALVIDGYQLDGYSDFNNGTHLNTPDGVRFTKFINSFICSSSQI
jgi:hypothetical protein